MLDKFKKAAGDRVAKLKSLSKPLHLQCVYGLETTPDWAVPGKGWVRKFSQD